MSSDVRGSRSDMAVLIISCYQLPVAASDWTLTKCVLNLCFWLLLFQLVWHPGCKVFVWWPLYKLSFLIHKHWWWAQFGMAPEQRVEQWVHWRNANADGRDANGEKCWSMEAGKTSTWFCHTYSLDNYALCLQTCMPSTPLVNCAHSAWIVSTSQRRHHDESRTELSSMNNDLASESNNATYHCFLWLLYL